MEPQMAVIFDVDGVLIDSYRPHFESWRMLAAEHGIDMTEQQFATTFGRTSRDIIAHFWGDQVMPEQIPAMDERKEALYREIIAHDFPAMDGAAALIDALDEAGFLLAVGSSGPPQNVELTLEMLGRTDRIDVKVTGADVERGKPDPQVFLIAAERLALPPAQCAVVEDAPAGIAAARAAGMTAIGLTGTSDAAGLTGADRIVASLRELGPVTIAELITHHIETTA